MSSDPARSRRPEAAAGVRSPRDEPLQSDRRARGTPARRGASARPSEPSLTLPEIRRYGRQLVLPEIGVAGQRRLKGAKALVVGVGGLGSPAALYLAAAGVGELGLADFDLVEPSNLHRQVLFGERDIGRRKLEAAADRLRDVNPSGRVVPHEVELDRGNVLDVVRGYDVVIDGTDNYPARYLINDACVMLGKPDVFGAIYRFEGQASVFDARRGPCYRCLFREPPPAGASPSCDIAGVLGALPGIIGVIQATEAIKLLLGLDGGLIGRLLLFDALAMRFREFGFPKDPDCPRCGGGRSGRPIDELAEACAPAPRSDLPRITAEELRAELAGPGAPLLVDVREPAEYAICHLPGARLIPQRDLPERLGELGGVRPLVVYCKTGGRSAEAVQLLLDRGITRVRHLEGGIDRWAEQIDPTVPRY